MEEIVHKLQALVPELDHLEKEMVELGVDARDERWESNLNAIAWITTQAEGIETLAEIVKLIHRFSAQVNYLKGIELDEQTLAEDRGSRMALDMAWDSIPVEDDSYDRMGRPSFPNEY